MRQGHHVLFSPFANIGRAAARYLWLLFITTSFRRTWQSRPTIIKQRRMCNWWRCSFLPGRLPQTADDDDDGQWSIPSRARAEEKNSYRRPTKRPAPRAPSSLSRLFRPPKRPAVVLCVCAFICKFTPTLNHEREGSLGSDQSLFLSLLLPPPNWQTSRDLCTFFFHFFFWAIKI